jgi:RNA polymerase sigma factor (sigma-70 family)
MPEAADTAGVSAAVADAHRRDWGLVLAATVRVTRDIDLAEECVQDAYAQALTAWGKSGIPDKPAAWLLTVARHRALDVARRHSVLQHKLPLMVMPESAEDVVVAARAHPWGIPSLAGEPDDRLRLVFTCCHPALSRESRVALTLKLVCGLSTGEVARAFLVSEPTMAARITRAKRKIQAAGIPYRVPSLAELPQRTSAVLDVVHLVFTTGHTAPIGESLVRSDLVERSIELCRLLRRLLPGNADVSGLLALILLTDARRATRVSEDGRLVLLEHQDRTRWDGGAIAEGLELVDEAAAECPSSRFTLQAAIAAVHAKAPCFGDTDWNEIVRLYDDLVVSWASPVVALNRAVAVGYAKGAAAGFAAIEEIAGDQRLRGYAYLHSARAEMLRRLGELDAARREFEVARALTANEVEREFLAEQLVSLNSREPR